MIHYPAVLAVMAPQTILHMKWFPRLERRDTDPQAAIVVFRVNAFRPAVTPFLFHRSPGEVEPRFVEESAEPIRCANPDQDWRRVRQNTKLLLACTQRLLDALVLGDVAGSHHGQDLFSVLVAHRFSAETKEPLLPGIHPDCPTLQILDGFTSEQLVDWPFFER